MSQDPSLFQRLKAARIFQVLAVYLGASWMILQIADVLQDAVGLPPWVSGLAVLLLLIGLVIILSTAWVQSLPSTTAREKAGELPTDWEIAPADVLDSLKAGRIPHLTWGRAILGGVMALSLLFGGAGLYVGFTGGPGFLGPQEVGAGEAAEGIAVVPFSVTGGEELELWREGMVDLLATNLDGMGGFRTIDSRTVMSKWRERVSGVESPDLRTSLEIAAETGARYAVVGALVGNPAGIRLSAELYDLSSGEEVLQVTKEGAADRVLELTSALSVDLTRELLGASGSAAVQERRIDALITPSLPALRAYLEGEAAFRNASFADAVTAYEEAVALDSLFALAWLRLSSSHGWLDNIGSPEAARAGERAAALVDRLPARDRIMVQAAEAARTGDASFFGEISESVRLYPDDPDLWFELGEFIYHVGLRAGVASLPQAVEAFERAVELDPDFGPYQVHPLELAIASGERELAEAKLERYRAATVDERNIREFELAIPLLLGDEEEAVRALDASRGLDMGTLARLRVAFVNRVDQYDRLRRLEWVNRDRAGADHQWLYYMLVNEGALERAARLTDSLDLPVRFQALGAGHALILWEEEAAGDFRAIARPESCETPVYSAFCQALVGAGRARIGDLDAARTSLDHLRARLAAADDAGREAAQAHADLVEGALAAREGRVADARRLLGAVARRGGNLAAAARPLLAEVELAEGNVTEAIRHHSGSLYDYTRTLATRSLARIYEDRGDAGQAAAYYRSFLEQTRAGDRDLPQIVGASAALERLGG